jgi:hypothetical protein
MNTFYQEPTHFIHRIGLHDAALKGGRAMQVHCNSDQTLAATAPSHANADQHDSLKTGNFLYQAATVLAILLLLISI